MAFIMLHDRIRTLDEPTVPYQDSMKGSVESSLDFFRLRNLSDGCTPITFRLGFVGSLRTTIGSSGTLRLWQTLNFEMSAP